MTRIAVGAVPLLLVPALGAAQGGFHPDTWVWSGVLAAWAAALALAVGARAEFLRREWPWVAVGLALLLWTLLSTLWSAERAQSLLEARRTVVYAAVVLALVAVARRGSAAVLVTATQVAVSALVLYALGRYLSSQGRVDPAQGKLLFQPLGYANAVGILAAMGMLLSFTPTADANRVVARAAAAAVIPPLALAIALSGSNASWLALAVGATAVVLLHPSPSSLLPAAVAVLPVTAVLVAIGHESRLTVIGASPRFGRPLVAVAAIACAALAAAGVVLTASWAPRRPQIRRSAVAIAIAVAVAAGGAVAVVRAGSTEPRGAYYHVALLEYRSHPLLGSGAGTFGSYWLRLGDPTHWGGALDAHSLYLEMLAELGPLGLLLLCAFLLYPLRHALRHRSVPGVAAAAGTTVAFLVHAGLDWDWEMPAVVVAALACAAAVAFAGPATGPGPPPALRRQRIAALTCALVLGAAALAGVRSTAEPSAASQTSEAPQSGASVLLLRRPAG